MAEQWRKFAIFSFFEKFPLKTKNGLPGGKPFLGEGYESFLNRLSE